MSRESWSSFATFALRFAISGPDALGKLVRGLRQRRTAGVNVARSCSTALDRHHITARGHSPALLANLDLHHHRAAVAVRERDAAERLHRVMCDGVTGTMAKRPEHRAELVFVHAGVECSAVHRTGRRRRDCDRRHGDTVAPLFGAPQPDFSVSLARTI